MDLLEADENFLARGTLPDFIEVAKAEGSYIFTSSGDRYIDFTSGWCVGNLGWNHPDIRRRLAEYRGPEYVSPSLLYRPWTELASMLAEITPGKLRKCFRAAGGTEAVDIALQVAMSCTRRHKFIAIEGSYHGNSLATRLVGSGDFGAWYDKTPIFCRKIRPPLDLEAANEIGRWLVREDVAAFIMEPIICNLGVLIPEDDFMKRVQEHCRDTGTLFIVDEVATGFGRTGRFFGTEYFSIEPDIMCLAKAMSSGFGPIGATIVTDEVAAALDDEDYYSTYGWHPVSVEAAIATIEFMKINQRKLLGNVQTMSRLFTERLNDMKYEYPPQIRIIGLAIAVEFDNTEYGPDIVQRAKKNRLLIADAPNGFALFPALTIDSETAEDGLDILERCL